jgi:Flp pilus assembly pilin Flp
MKNSLVETTKTVTREINGSEDGAVTIEYVVIVIIVVGIGGALLVFQDTIKNAVTTVQDSLSNLVDNMTANAAGGSGTSHGIVTVPAVEPDGM